MFRGSFGCVIFSCVCDVVCWLSGSGVFSLFSDVVVEAGVGCELYLIRKYLPNS